MARKAKRDWFEAGIALLAEVGPTGITVDALCKKLQVTKGSFYHHFKNYEDFKISFLNFYEAEGTLDIIDRLQDLPTASAKLRGLLEIIVGYTAVSEIYLRAWAIQDEMVRAVQMRVDGRRLAYVEELLLEMLNDPIEAQRKAKLMYVILVGAEQMQPPIVGEALRALFDEFWTLIDLE